MRAAGVDDSTRATAARAPAASGGSHTSFTEARSTGVTQRLSLHRGDVDDSGVQEWRQTPRQGSQRQEVAHLVLDFGIWLGFRVAAVLATGGTGQGVRGGPPLPAPRGPRGSGLAVPSTSIASFSSAIVGPDIVRWARSVLALRQVLHLVLGAYGRRLVHARHLRMTPLSWSSSASSASSAS